VKKEKDEAPRAWRKAKKWGRKERAVAGRGHPFPRPALAPRLTPSNKAQNKKRTIKAALRSKLPRAKARTATSLRLAQAG